MYPGGLIHFSLSSSGIFLSFLNGKFCYAHFEDIERFKFQGSIENISVSETEFQIFLDCDYLYVVSENK